MFDALIIGGGASGMSCALVLGSAVNKAYAKDKQIGIIMHQKASHLQNAIFNNALGLPTGTTGQSVLDDGSKQLANNYPHVVQIEKEKVLEIQPAANGFNIITNKNSYTSKIVVVAVGYTNLLSIKGLETYIAPHPRAEATKERIWLQNEDHLVAEGLYVAGTLAGWRSQFNIAAGSGAQVATDILTLWNNGIQSHVHDKL
ncbi:NAD(P)/FAD-dependent oxidoreductase [Mangrovimonas sp. YM274]|uniref:NAD(P)/FAD-dependent oxidoreductase n=1 Tax=Mangrovimonas sp. YM274 TaxID=3070660 RepID=UPI0027DD177A|nr:NAD(P)/FAD-dependent oxidoreductase [Mangrovimonas sp. YM274]WMI68666.1 NAD(P)/FAD-dependent oxidoreductase [Mangrovimonas sp. YM274]